MKALFLDYDGVVNIPIWDAKGAVCTFAFPKENTVNHYQAVQWISELCQKFNYKIVVTSSWRRSENYAECLKNGGLRADVEIVGKTDILDDVDYRIKRGSEIEAYLKDHPEIEYYLIIDDEDIALPAQKNHFIHTNGCYGFMLPDFDKAKQIAELDERHGGSFWDRSENQGLSLLDRLKYEVDLAEDAYAEAWKESRRLNDVKNAAIKEYEKEFYRGKNCNSCRYSCVSEFSFDGWHNLCGAEDAPCTCCNSRCEYYKPDNKISSFLKSLNINLDAGDVEAFSNFCGDIFQDDSDDRIQSIATAIKMIKAWKNID